MRDERCLLRQERVLSQLEGYNGLEETISPKIFSSFLKISTQTQILTPNLASNLTPNPNLNAQMNIDSYHFILFNLKI